MRFWLGAASGAIVGAFAGLGLGLSRRGRARARPTPGPSLRPGPAWPSGDPPVPRGREAAAGPATSPSPPVGPVDRPPPPAPADPLFPTFGPPAVPAPEPAAPGEAGEADEPGDDPSGDADDELWARLEAARTEIAAELAEVAARPDPVGPQAITAFAEAPPGELEPEVIDVDDDGERPSGPA